MKEIEVGDYYRIIKDNGETDIPSIGSIIYISRLIDTPKERRELDFNSDQVVFEFQLISGDIRDTGVCYFDKESIMVKFLIELVSKPETTIPNESDLLIEQSKKLYNL